MVAVKDLSNLKASGIVGMGSGWNKQDRNDLFILKMKNSGAIDKAVFSMYVTDNMYGGRLTIGGFDVKKYARHRFPLKYHKVYKGYSSWWLTTLDKARFAGVETG